MIRRLPLRAKIKIAFILWRETHGILFTRPVAFSLRSSLAMFALLPAMPEHVLAIPIAIGGGLAVGFLLWRL